MSKSSHTPGPWAVEDHDGKTWVVAYCGDDDPWFVCEPEPFIGPGTTDRAPANAHLIAAAPDLYAALERAETHLCDLNVRETEWPRPQIRAALRKARGEA